jgi:hypothetical protein
MPKEPLFSALECLELAYSTCSWFSSSSSIKRIKSSDSSLEFLLLDFPEKMEIEKQENRTGKNWE